MIKSPLSPAVASDRPSGLNRTAFTALIIKKKYTVHHEVRIRIEYVFAYVNYRLFADKIGFGK